MLNSCKTQIKEIKDGSPSFITMVLLLYQFLLAVGPNGVIFQNNFVPIVWDSLGCQKHNIFKKNSGGQDTEIFKKVGPTIVGKN